MGPWDYLPTTSSGTVVAAGWWAGIDVSSGACSGDPMHLSPPEPVVLRNRYTRWRWDTFDTSSNTIWNGKPDVCHTTYFIIMLPKQVAKWPVHIEWIITHVPIVLYIGVDVIQWAVRASRHANFVDLVPPIRDCYKKKKWNAKYFWMRFLEK